MKNTRDNKGRFTSGLVSLTNAEKERLDLVVLIGARNRSEREQASKDLFLIMFTLTLLSFYGVYLCLL